MGIRYNTSIVRDGLVLHLDAANKKSYPGTGTVWKDLSGNGNNGTLVNGVAFSNDNKGTMSFDGSSKRATITSVQSSSFLTANTWYRRNEVTSSTIWRTLFATATTNIHHLIMQQNTRNLGIFDGSFRDFGFNPPADNNFHNYSVIYENQSNASLYVDGNFVSNIITTLNLQTSGISSIGNWNSGNYWAGDISTAQIYNRALSVQEIKQNFEALRGRYGI